MNFIFCFQTELLAVFPNVLIFYQPWKIFEEIQKYMSTETAVHSFKGRLILRGIFNKSFKSKEHSYSI